MRLAERLVAAQALQAPRMTPITLPFGEWLPDIPAYRNPGITSALNVRPTEVGYEPMRGRSAISDALTARCQGAIATLDPDGAVRTYAGDVSKLYALSGVSFADVSKAATTYAVPADGNWSFALDGTKLIASYYSTGSIEMQSITLGGANFADHLSSTLKPRFADIAKVRDFLMGVRSWDAVDEDQPNRVWWSAFGDTADFDPDATTQCDFQDLDAGDGWLYRVIGGEYARVYAEGAIYRLTYVGGDVFFQIDRVVKNKGTRIPGSVATLGRGDIFLSTDGFYLFDGTDAHPIGKNKVDRTFYNEVDLANAHKISSAVDLENSVYTIAYPTGSSDGVVSKMLHFHWPTGKWSEAEIECELIFPDLSRGLTLDQLDSVSSSIDALTPSLDSRVWSGGDPYLGVFNTSHALGALSGDFLAATLDTTESGDGAITHIGEVRPLVTGEDTSASVSLGLRDNQLDSPVYGTAQALSEGKADFDDEARYFRARVSLESGFSNAQGVLALVRRSGQF